MLLNTKECKKCRKAFKKLSQLFFTVFSFKLIWIEIKKKLEKLFTKASLVPKTFLIWIFFFSRHNTRTSPPYFIYRLRLILLHRHTKNRFLLLLQVMNFVFLFFLAFFMQLFHNFIFLFPLHSLHIFHVHIFFVFRRKVTFVFMPYQWIFCGFFFLSNYAQFFRCKTKRARV